MSRLRALVIAGVFAGIVVGHGVASADGTGEIAPATTATYNQLFGQDEKQVIASRNGKDAAKFAAKLMTSARSLTDDPALVGLLCQRAYAYGIQHPDGYPVAIDAAKRLAELDPSKSAECHGKTLDVYRLQFKNATGADRKKAGIQVLAEMIDEGDQLSLTHSYPQAIKRYKDALAFANDLHSARAEEINEKVKACLAKKTVAAKIDHLAEQLKTSNDPAIAKELVRAIVTELDEPAEALRYADLDPDDKPMLTLAKTKVADLSDPDLLKLAAWYRELADHTTGLVKTNTLLRSKDYYDAYLVAHKTQDGDRLSAQLSVDKVIRLLNTSGGAATADEIVIWNGNNNGGGDRGCKVLNVILSYHGEVVWKREGIPIAWAADKVLPLSVIPPHIIFDTVRIEIPQWQANGASLDEIQVLRAGKNIAFGAKVKVSGGLPGLDNGALLTDGITDNSKRSFWDGPEGIASWVEVDLSSVPRPKGF